MKLSFSIVALPLAFLFAGPALAQSMCVVAGNQPIMGANLTADFDVAGGARMHVRHPSARHAHQRGGQPAARSMGP